MNFGLTTKFSEIDFEGLSHADLLLIGGGCGGGGGSTSVQSVQSVQAAAQVAAGAPGANGGVSATVGASGTSGYVSIGFSYGSAQGGPVNGTANVEASTGNVTVTSTPGGRFWVSVSGFFTWLFGSH